MNDLLIRKSLRMTLSERYSSDQNTLIIEELGLKHGSSRIDLAVINGSFHGYEIKSDKDTLERLPSQMKAYNSIFDYITLVVGYRHAYAALKLAPHWWGIQIAENCSDRVIIYNFRKPKRNPSPDIFSIVKLLWRSEAIEILDKISSANGVRSKPRKFIYQKLIAVAGKNLCRVVRNQLKRRKDWRAPAPLK